MPTEKDLFDMVTDLLSEVDLYLDEVRNLHYDNEFREFSTSKGKRNYEKVIKRLQGLNIEDPEDAIHKSMNLEDFKEYYETVLRIILGKKYEEDIQIAKHFISAKPYFPKTDVKTVYKDIAGESMASDFIISKKHNPIQLSQAVNSEIILLLKPLYENFSNTISNIHYKRLPGTIAAYMAIYELSHILKQKSLIDDYEEYYIYNDSSYAKGSGRFIADLLPKHHRRNVLEHKEHSDFSFLISDIYSSSLISAYLEDKASFLNKYRSMISGNVSIPEYLAYYGLTIQDGKTTQVYQDRIDNVEKRYQLK